MGSCNIKQNDKPLYISFTPKMISQKKTHMKS